jgi:hypothetical protein
LAKLLNKHFTNVTKAIAEERAAAEAALRDLEARKANTSEFTESAGGLSIYENLYLELQQKKAECKRKERETLLLYQRYVDKFGSTGAIAVPSSRDMKIGFPPVPSTPSGSRPLYDPSSYLPSGISATDVLTPSSVKVPQMASEIEESLLKHISSGGDRLPSIESMGWERSYQAARSSEEREDYEFTMRAREARGVDYKSSPMVSRDKTAAASQFGIPMVPDAKASAVGVRDSTPVKKFTSPNGSQSSTPLTAAETLIDEYDDDDDDDDRSALSGLTSVNSVILSDAEIRLTEFLKTETEAIRKMMTEEEESIASGAIATPVESPSELGDESAQAAEKAEEMVHQMRQMLADYEAKATEDYVAHTPVASHEPYVLETSDPNQSWIVLWDSNYQREYYHETTAGITQWEKPITALDTSMSVEWEKQPSSLPGDEDYVPMVDYTRKAKKGLLTSSQLTEVAVERRMSRRELYRLKQRRLRSRRRLLVVAVSALTFGALAYGYHRHQTDPLFAEKVSRVVQPATMLIDRVVGIEKVKEINNVVYETVVKYVPGLVPEEQKRRIREEAERKVRAEIDRQEKERVARLNAERRAAAERARLEAEQKAQREDEERARLEKIRLGKEEEKRREAERKERERQLKEDEARKELDRRAKGDKEKREREARDAVERQRKQKEKEDRKARKQKRKEAEERKRREIAERKRRALERPWHCNVPLSYVLNKKCRKLSSANPVFDLKGIVDAMIQ